MKTINSFSFRKILLISAVLCFFISLNLFSQEEGRLTSDYPSRAQDLKVAKNLVAAYEAGDWQELRRNVSSQAMFYNLGSYDSLNLDQTVGYWKKGREIATPHLGNTGEWLTASISEGSRKGNWVFHWGYNTLSYPNGESITFPYHVALKMVDEKVKEVHFYYDNNKIIRELGYEIQPPIEEDHDNHDGL